VPVAPEGQPSAANGSTRRGHRNRQHGKYRMRFVQTASEGVVVDVLVMVVVVVCSCGCCCRGCAGDGSGSGV